MQDIIVKSVLKNKLFKDSYCTPEDFQNIKLSINCINESKILFRKGQKIDSVFLLQSGEINHFVEDDNGKTKVISYKEGDFIPHDFTNSSISDSTAIAVRDTYYYLLNEETVDHFLSTNKQVKENYEKLAKELKGTLYDQPSFNYPLISDEEPKVESEKPVDEIEETRIKNITREVEPEEPPENGIDIKTVKRRMNQENQFDIVRYDDIDILTVNIKEATLAYSPKLKEILTGLIEGGTTKLIVDLDYCDIIDSTFLGTLVVILKKIGGFGGEMRLVCGNKPAWMIFEMTGMGKVFNTSPELKSALEAFYN